MKRYEVIITSSAARDITAAHAWLSARNPVFAERWLERIRDAILSLDSLPESHALAPENDAFDDEIRHLLVGRGTPWRAFFTIKGSTVHVLHVRYGGRDAWRP